MQMMMMPMMMVMMMLHVFCFFLLVETRKMIYEYKNIFRYKRRVALRPRRLCFFTTPAVEVRHPAHPPALDFIYFCNLF